MFYGYRVQQLVGKQIGKYTIKEELGSGCFGTVYRGLDETNNCIVAIKATLRDKIRKHPKILNAQISIMRKCNNQNVVKFIDVFDTQLYKCIVMEYCDGGTLEAELYKNTRFSEQTAVTYLKQIINGFKGLHQIGAMHRDFKLQNIALHKEVCKIIDLGFAKIVDQNYANSYIGTPRTMAPEVFNRQPYTALADIWSLGIVFYHMLFGCQLYNYQNRSQVLNQIEANNLNLDHENVHLSQNSKDFIRRCLKINPNQRIKWKQIYAHPLIKNEKISIYGPSQSHLKLISNQDFYQKQLKIEQSMVYPEIKYSQYSQVPKGLDVVDIICPQNESENKKSFYITNLAFQRFYQIYMKKRKDKLFAIKHIISYFQDLKHKQGLDNLITFFLITKKTYLNMINFHKHLLVEIRTKKLCQQLHDPRLIQEFIKSKAYQKYFSIIVQDIRTIYNQLKKFIAVINENACNQKITNEINDINNASEDLDSLVRQHIDISLKLIEKISNRQNTANVDGHKYKTTVKVYQALKHFKQQNQDNIQQKFQKKLIFINYKYELNPFLQTTPQNQTQAIIKRSAAKQQLQCLTQM